MSKKAELLEQIEQYESDLDGLKMKIKEEPKHITWEELDEKDKFFRLLPGRKRLMDTVKMISYRAESAMACLLKKTTVDMAAARRLLQDLFVTEADILPRPEENLLHVRVHNASKPAANAALAQLFLMSSTQPKFAILEPTCACFMNLQVKIPGSKLAGLR